MSSRGAAMEIVLVALLALAAAAMPPSAQADTVTDIDGNVYSTVTIGTQVWMVENLATTRCRDGSPISNVPAGTAWAGLGTGAYCDYGNVSGNATTYGRLYNWYAVNDARGIAPTGWHVATDAEWTIVTEPLGGDGVAGGKLKEAGAVHWLSPNVGATNEAGFIALPGGYRAEDGTFFGSRFLGSWWSSTESGASDAWARGIFSDAIVVDRGGYYSKRVGFSVRCVRDVPGAGVEDGGDAPPRRELSRNYPNPFARSTRIRFEVSRPSIVSLKVFNVLGEEVSTLLDESLPAGTHERDWNANGLPSGMYWYKLQAGDRGETRRIVLTR